MVWCSTTWYYLGRVRSRVSHFLLAQRCVVASAGSFEDGLYRHQCGTGTALYRRAVPAPLIKTVLSPYGIYIVVRLQCCAHTALSAQSHARTAVRQGRGRLGIGPLNAMCTVSAIHTRKQRTAQNHQPLPPVTVHIAQSPCRP